MSLYRCPLVSRVATGSQLLDEGVAVHLFTGCDVVDELVEVCEIDFLLPVTKQLFG